MTYITSTPPKKYKHRLYQFLNFILGPLGRFLLRRKFHFVQVTGTEYLKGGPKLVVMNHSCPLDSVLITFFGRSPLQFLITEPFMQGSFASKVAAALGQITKRKLDYDPGSIQLMKRWSDCGAHVALFPEGKFSWDGSASSLMPGLDQLIKYLKLPVVCVHLSNGNRVKPAWAQKMRKTGITITIHPPITMESENDILASIEERIFQTQSTPVNFPSEGHDLALGLSRITRFCLNCESDNSLFDQGNFMKCNSCGKSLEIDVNNGIKGSSFRSIKDLFDKLYLFLDGKYQTNSSIKSLDTVSLYDATKKDWILIAKGKMSINSQSINIGDFHLDLKEVIDHTIDWGDIIILRTRKQRFTLKINSDSRLIFEYIIRKARHA